MSRVSIRCCLASHSQFRQRDLIEGPSFSRANRERKKCPHARARLNGLFRPEIEFWTQRHLNEVVWRKQCPLEIDHWRPLAYDSSNARSESNFRVQKSDGQIFAHGILHEQSCRSLWRANRSRKLSFCLLCLRGVFFFVCVERPQEVGPVVSLVRLRSRLSGHHG